MKNNPSTIEPGMLIRGPDGEVYHVTFDKLKAFKIGEDVQKQVDAKKVFESNVLGRVNSPREVGLSMTEEPTKTAIVDLSFLFRS